MSGKALTFASVGTSLDGSAAIVVVGDDSGNIILDGRRVETSRLGSDRLSDDGSTSPRVNGGSGIRFTVLRGISSSRLVKVILVDDYLTEGGLRRS